VGRPLDARAEPVKCESWKSFLSRAYWETELQP
jgi:hypothetical protein